MPLNVTFNIEWFKIETIFSNGKLKKYNINFISSKQKTKITNVKHYPKIQEVPVNNQSRLVFQDRNRLAIELHPKPIESSKTSYQKY